MVERYNDDIVFTGQVAALVIGVSTTADEEAATMQPDHDGALAAVVYMRRPYIQHQTVFTDRQVGKGQDRSEEHTSELQSLMRISYAVFCLKKKNHTQ